MTRVIADLHIHGRYSRATSKKLNIEEITRFARVKGLDLLGSGDFTHPQWLKELRDNLVEASDTGFFKPAMKMNSPVHFVITTEVSTIFTFRGQIKKIHHIVLTPSFETAIQINARLTSYGDLDNDGRPTLDMAAPELVEEVMEVSSKNVVIPSHVWTPWFSLFGAFSGFDRVEDCYQDMTKHISALETGLSSDPPMNWRLSRLDKYALVSNSDSHCVHPDTRIYLVDGRSLPIKKLDHRSALLTLDFKNDLKLKKSQDFMVHKVKSPSMLLQIITRSRSITVTPLHRFFVSEKERIIEKCALKLKTEDRIACTQQNICKRASFTDPLFNETSRKNKCPEKPLSERSEHPKDKLESTKRQVNDFTESFNEKSVKKHPSLSSSLRNHSYHDIRWEKIIEVEEIPSSHDYVYDLTVPDYENYVANGIIVHNSAWPWRMGREANVFDVKRLNYHEIVYAILNKDPNCFKFTVETNPAYGKYHWTGHRNCGVSLPPKEAIKLGNVCPVCRRKLTTGVEQRIEELADRPSGFKPKKAIGHIHLLPLSEIIAKVLNVSYSGSQKVWRVYNALVARFGDEYTVLMDAAKDDMAMTVDPEIADAIFRVRTGQVRIIPGYDGVYGELSLLNGGKPKRVKQRSIEEFIPDET